MKKRRTWLIALALLIVAAVGGLVLFRMRRSEAGSAEVLRTGQAVMGELTLSVAASGSVVPAERATLLFQSSGRVLSVAAKPGAHYEAGASLVTMDTRELERAVRQAEISLQQADLRLQQLQDPARASDVELAEVSAQNAAQVLEVARIGKEVARVDADGIKLNAQRAREQAWRDYVETGESDAQALEALQRAEEQEAIAATNAQLVIERAAQQYSSALLQYEQAQQALEATGEGPTPEAIRLAEIGIEQAELALQQAKVALGKATLVAPFAGTVARVDARPVAFASAGQAAVVLVDDSSFYVDVNIDEVDVARVAIGQDATVTLDAFSDVALAGVVDSIAPVATNLGGAIVYPLHIRLNQTDRIALRDGLTASVQITVGVRSGLVLAPNWAVRTEQSTGETYCYVIRDGAPVRVAISVGERNDTFTEIVDGLAAGETVALVIENQSLLEQSREGILQMRQGN